MRRITVIGAGDGALALGMLASAAARQKLVLASLIDEERAAREAEREAARARGPHRCGCGVITASGPLCRKCKKGSS